VIPTVLLIGIVVGRWWFVPVAGVAWVVLLLGANGLDLVDTPIAAGLAMANAAVGVGCHKLIAETLRYVRKASF
jgi:hypothetical protein